MKHAIDVEEEEKWKEKLAEYKEKMDVENIKPQFERYYHINNNSGSGSGCMVSILMLLFTSLIVACSVL